MRKFSAKNPLYHNFPLRLSFFCIITEGFDALSSFSVLYPFCTPTVEGILTRLDLGATAGIGGIAFVGLPKKGKECVSNLAESYGLLWLVACCHVNPGHVGALGTVTRLCTVKTLLGYGDFAKIDMARQREAECGLSPCDVFLLKHDLFWLVFGLFSV